MTQPIPYPVDTGAKGWRFELDHERVWQSDTWAVCSAELRPWLLMLWVVAWRQVPCGSMPNDDQLIAARIGMSPKAFAKAKPMLMRGWWLADDGRLYQSTIVGLVQQMLAKREAERLRKGGYRAKKQSEGLLRDNGDVPLDTRDVPRDTHGTPPGVQPESKGMDSGIHPEGQHQNQYQNKEIHPPTPQGGAVVGSVPTPGEDPPGFVAFWAAWPPGGRKGARGKCLERWRKKRFEVKAGLIVAHVKAMAVSAEWTREGGQYRPAPLAYLGGESWDGAAPDACPAAPDIFAGAI